MWGPVNYGFPLTTTFIYGEGGGINGVNGESSKVFFDYIIFFFTIVIEIGFDRKDRH